MTRKSKKAKHIKKSNKRISKIKLFIVTLGVLLIITGLYKGLKFTVHGVGQIKENITVLAEVVFGPGEDTSNVNREKQFDLEDEKNDNNKKHVVYIDVGHGGTDEGFKSVKGPKEKDLTLQISKLVSNRLSSQGDVSVIMSRSTDTNLSNSQRVEDGTKQNADVFVSIHVTANDDSSAKGVETFYRGDSNDASDELATLVQKSIVSYVDLDNRGAKPFTFDVLRDNAMPAILIECGFLSNPEEEKKLTNPSFQKELAEGISQGILSFLDMQG